MHSNQPFYAYHESGRYTVKLRSAPQATTLTEAGGYGPEGNDVGIVTMRNLRTGAVGHTERLGNGMVKGALNPPVVVERGDSYEILETPAPWPRPRVTSSSRRWASSAPVRPPFKTVGHEYDRAELFALPHPWFAHAAAHSRHAPAAKRKRASSFRGLASCTGRAPARAAPRSSGAYGYAAAAWAARLRRAVA